MKIAKKTLFYSLFFVSVIFIIVYGLIVLLRPTEIITVYQSDSFSRILVKNPPLTDRAKIAWWQKNQEILKNQYHVPQPEASYGSWNVSVWNIGNGFKEREESTFLDFFPTSQRCFDEIKATKNCINYDRVITIVKTVNGITRFSIKNRNYTQLTNGEIVRRKDD
ncbi:DUF943 family protein [Paramixta manurensis]|uniref:DUF943 family protein n=1 Tax=Paramixta manurensis TaxID=2740817 RepID=A0A6M8UHR8_9GAMM|nr:DUF943 family protein [Erwiniaceae bacterium PD-1]